MWTRVCMCLDCHIFFYLTHIKWTFFFIKWNKSPTITFISQSPWCSSPSALCLATKTTSEIYVCFQECLCVCERVCVCVSVFVRAWACFSLCVIALPLLWAVAMVTVFNTCCLSTSRITLCTTPCFPALLWTCNTHTHTHTHRGWQRELMYGCSHIYYHFQWWQSVTITVASSPA